MTLSGQSDWNEKRAAARAARAEREARTAAKRPWQLPLIIAVAVAIVAVAIVWTLFLG
jgi:hypothetical protein